MKAKIATGIALFFPPCKIKNTLLRLCKWNIGNNVRIGFSYIVVKNIKLEINSSIGHGNFIKVDSLYLGESAHIQKLNQIQGPLIVILQKQAAIGNQNKIVRAKKPVSWGHSMLKLGELSKITSRHTIDCMRPVIFGNFSILAGYSSQVWSHGFVHAQQGSDRYRVDGSISIGNNVYIGSASIINPGIKIGDGITVGSSSSVSRSLLQPGLYVNQSLRYIEFDYEESLGKYPTVKKQTVQNKVIHKKYDS
jgi:acetyltransferase-like isoleucine patch superfamily enzyme